MIALYEESEDSGAGERMGRTIGADLDATAADYSEHNRLLHQKLASILHERYDVHARKWFTVPHPSVPEMPEAGELRCPPHEALDGFAKDAGNMYKALSKTLSVESVKGIFSTAFVEIAVKFRKHIEELGSVQEAAVYTTVFPIGDRFLYDLASLNERLSTLKEITQPTEQLLSDLAAQINELLRDRLNPETLGFLKEKGLLP